jgi:hypothetical protein
MLMSDRIIAVFLPVSKCASILLKKHLLYYTQNNVFHLRSTPGERYTIESFLQNTDHIKRRYENTSLVHKSYINEVCTYPYEVPQF